MELLTIAQVIELINNQKLKNSRTPISLVNLQNKSISEFTSEDTIYITKMESGCSVTYLCQFIKFEKGVVYGKALQASPNPSIYEHSIKKGLEVSAKLEKTSLYGRLPNDSHDHYFSANSLGRFYDENLEMPKDQMNIPKHESYGMVSLTKINSLNTPLFGSSIKHDKFISLRISKGSIKRNLSQDWYHPEEEMIEVYLSHAQFSEMITNFNTEGVPCTISRVEGKRMEATPFVSKVEQTNNEFANVMANLTVKLKNLTEKTEAILAKPTVNKADREIIKKDIGRLSQEIKSNIPFMSQQFAEQMDKTITEAKAEIEAYINKKLDGGNNLEGPTTNGLLGEGK